MYVKEKYLSQNRKDKKMQNKQMYLVPQAKVFLLDLDEFLKLPVSSSPAIDDEKEILNRTPRPRRSADE